ncbi:hypothetical protein LTR08_001038 [Meristemomyces frigidus]|nr:hypothetical protein LTR08_001038 [Meristemomyces frigidus]
MPYDHMSNGYAPPYNAHSPQQQQQHPPAQLYSHRDGSQYTPQPQVVLPLPQQQRRVVQHATPYQPTSLHPSQPQPGYNQRSPVQFPQGYQQPYQPVPSGQPPAQVLQHSLYQQQQYYQPQQLQQSPAQGYYQASTPDTQSTPSYGQPLRYPELQQQTRPQYRTAPQQSPAQARHPLTVQSARPQQQTPQALRTPIRAAPATTPSYQRTVAHVQIPVQRPIVPPTDAGMPREAKRRRSNDGNVIAVCSAPTAQRSSASQRLKQAPVASSPLTALPSSQIPPAPQPNVDYQAVLLSLSDEYVGAAYSLSASLASPDSTREQYEQYHALMSTGMGCLQSVLKSYRQTEPRKEARIRLRLASLLHDETENIEEADETLSKGIALCERSRLPDLKYAMQHLLVRVTSRTSPKAAIKAVDKLVAEVEALGLAHWMYAFRFLRVSLGTQTGHHSDTAAVLKHLNTISSTAEDLRHTAVQIVAATMEAMLHLQSGGPDALELAQRALAAARTHQLSPEMERMPQIRALLDCLDIASAVLQYNPDQVAVKMQQMQVQMDTATREAGWRKDGSFLVPLGLAATDDTAADTGGIMLKSKDGEAVLTFSWLNNSQLYALGYLLSGMASMNKDCGDRRAASYFSDGRKMTEVAPDAASLPLAASLVRTGYQVTMSIAFRLQLVLAYCARSEWTLAHQELRDIHKHLARVGEQGGNSNEVVLTYLEALCKQGLGDLDGALQLYSTPELTFQPGGKDVRALRDMQALSTMNSILILRSVSRDQEAEALHTAVESYCLTHPNKALVAAYYIVKATAEANHAIIKRKQYLQSAVQAAQVVKNQLLLCVILNNMTEMFFRGIVGQQAMKSAGAGRTLALRTQNKLWTAVACRMLGSTFELCGEYDRAATANYEAQQGMQALSPELRRTLQDDRL